MYGRMTTIDNWAGFRAAEPALAKEVQQRFEKYRHHVLATLRKDGSPRVTGIEADFRFGELWLGMMPGSRKAQDLQRDPRFALHANPGPDADMADGDVRVAGRAMEVTDAAAFARYLGRSWRICSTARATWRKLGTTTPSWCSLIQCALKRS